MKKISLILITAFCISCSDDTSSSNDSCDEYETALNELTEVRNALLNTLSSTCNNDEKCIESLKNTTSNQSEWGLDDLENRIEDNKQKLEECRN